MPAILSSQLSLDNGDNANFSINGGLRQTNEFLVDGVPDNAVTARANHNVAYIPTVDTTQEFKIITNFTICSTGAPAAAS